MLIDGRRVPAGTTVQTDICVIGAGPAGLALATRLADTTRLEVLVLESGQLEFDPQAQALAKGEVVGDRYFPIEETRIRAFGGSSWSWGGVLSPFEPIDFAKRTWVADSGWPFALQELQRFYADALSLCQADPEFIAAEPWTTTSRHIEPTDAKVEPGPIYIGPPVRFGKVCAGAFRESDRLNAYLGATAVRLAASPAADRVEAVDVAAFSGNRWRVAAQTFVLAAGGIENPRLLLASNDVEPQGLGNSHDVVGRFFMEHPRITDRLWIDGDGRGLEALIAGTAGEPRFGRVRLTDAVQTRERLLNYHANLAFGHAGQDQPPWQALRRLAIARKRPWNESPFFQDAGGGRMGVHRADVATVLRHPLRACRAALGVALAPRTLRRFISITSTMEQAPSPQNRVVLSAARDMLDMPSARLEWTLGAEEHRTYQRGLDLVVEYLQERIPGLSTARLERAVWPDAVRGTWHHMGTTRMHVDPRQGVVDENCRVHGIGNLYVAGSSIYPNGGSAGPTLTLVALGLRLAEHLRQGHRDS